MNAVSSMISVMLLLLWPLESISISLFFALGYGGLRGYTGQLNNAFPA